MKTLKECKDCEGTGKAELSPCCGAGYDSDMLMCYECHEHLGDEDIECENCNGTGEIENE